MAHQAKDFFHILLLLTVSIFNFSHLIRVCVGDHVHMHVWRLQVNFRCSPSSLVVAE